MLAWIELTGSSLDGTVIEVRQEATPLLPPDHAQATMVPTGSVVWVDERPIEVYVPEDRLDAWTAEHLVDG